MRKIVFATPRLYGGGAERVTATLVNELSRDPENEIHLICYRAGKGDYPLSDAVRCHRAAGDAAAVGENVFQKIGFLRSTIRQIAPDCVVTLAGPSMTALLTLAVIGLRTPLVLSERNDPRNYPKKRILRISRMITYALCRGIVFQTGDARNCFPKFIRNKGVVIPNPITGDLPPVHAGERAKTIVNWCRLHPQKNIDLLIDAFSDVAQKHPEHTLHIYGDGPELPRLTGKAQSMGLDHRIFLHGHTKEIFSVVNDAGMFVSSSDYEGMSNSMLEAIALGIPTICTDCPIGGARETISDGVNGLLTPVGDRAALASAMSRILDDARFAQHLSSNGVRLRSTHSACAVTQQWLDFLKQTIFFKEAQHGDS